MSSKQQTQILVDILPPAKWLRHIYPSAFSAEFADHHLKYWRHIDSIRRGEKQAAFFLILARGGGKTSSAEATPVYLGAKDKRKFCLYVRGTQDKANESIQNISTLMEAPTFAEYYPNMARRRIGKYGNTRGWNVSQLHTASGFSAVALGLDAAVRGVKIDNYRPDLIILDDIDDVKDTPASVEKKIKVLTKSILPAGSTDVIVLGMQNVIHNDSIFKSIADNEADFLIQRQVVGPVPAITDLTYEFKHDDELDRNRYYITGGIPTWPGGQSLEVCQAQINEWGLSAFLSEAQHEIAEDPGGIFSHLEYQHVKWREVPPLLNVVVWVDPAVTSKDGSDSMGIQADGIDQRGMIYRLWSWEQITTPEDAIKRAIQKAIELKASCVGVETDQGGDTWLSVYAQAWQDLIKTNSALQSRQRPMFKQAKAGAGHGPKVHRAQQMLVDYERGIIKHVIGTHKTLERALYRFPKTKPFDLTDAAYWSWNDLKTGTISSDEW